MPRDVLGDLEERVEALEQAGGGASGGGVSNPVPQDITDRDIYSWSVLDATKTMQLVANGIFHTSDPANVASMQMQLLPPVVNTPLVVLDQQSTNATTDTPYTVKGIIPPGYRVRVTFNGMGGLHGSHSHTIQPLS